MVAGFFFKLINKEFHSKNKSRNRSKKKKKKKKKKKNEENIPTKFLKNIKKAPKLFFKDNINHAKTWWKINHKKQKNLIPENLSNLSKIKFYLVDNLNVEFQKLYFLGYQFQMMEEDEQLTSKNKHFFIVAFCFEWTYKWNTQHNGVILICIILVHP